MEFVDVHSVDKRVPYWKNTSCIGERISIIIYRGPVWSASVLGPVLIILYVNDIGESISSTFRLFANDCVLYRGIKSKQDQLILRRRSSEDETVGRVLEDEV